MASRNSPVRLITNRKGPQVAFERLRVSRSEQISSTAYVISSTRASPPKQPRVVFPAESRSPLRLRVSDACPARRPGLADGQASGSLPGRKPRSAGNRSGVWAQLWRLRRGAGGPRCADEAVVGRRGVKDVLGAERPASWTRDGGGHCSLAGAVGSPRRKRPRGGTRRFAGEDEAGWRCLAHEVLIRIGVGLTVRGA